MPESGPLPRQSKPPSEWTCLRNVADAARDLDQMFGGKYDRWTLGGKVFKNEDPVAQALLSLHDYLNDLAARRDLNAEEPRPCSQCGWVDSDGGCNCG